MEFHISGRARKRYDFSDKLFTYNGNVIFADLRAVREFTAKINLVRAKEGREPMSIGELNALGLMDEIMHAFMDKGLEREKVVDCLSYVMRMPEVLKLITQSPC